MKKFASHFLCFVVGIILSGTVVYATLTYNASQIMYTKSNNQEVTLDTALTELYTSVNTTIADFHTKFDTLDIPFAIESYSNSTNSFSLLYFNSNIYNYNSFELTNTTAGSGTCEIRGTTTSGYDILSVNTRYTTANYSKIYIKALSSDNLSMFNCRYNVHFYNV